MRVLVTGGTGTLGREVVRALGAQGAQVRVLSRRPAPPDAPSRAQHSGAQDAWAQHSWAQHSWARGDLVTGEGLPAALRGADAVLHAAHDPQRPARDLQGLRMLLATAEAAGVPRLVSVSIVGATDIPGVPYYRAKALGEALVRRSPLETSVFRATQFFPFVAGILGTLDRLPWLLLPRGAQFQPVDVGEVGAALARHLLSGSSQDGALVGPEVLTVRELAGTWQAARGAHKRVVEVPLPLPAGRALAAGRLTSSGAPRGERRWADWLAAQQPRS